MPNRTPITVLQHPRERRHPLGTARLLRLGLQQVRLEICWDLRPTHVPPQAGVLYPHPNAILLQEAPVAPEHLIVLDGTWHGARKLYQANPWLRALPHYAITPDAVDRYRIRKEPAPHCTSTLEATVQALKLLEPDTPGLEGLLQAFTTMIDRQMAHIGRDPNHHVRKKRPRQRLGPVPAVWRAQYERLVLLYTEYTAYDTPAGKQRELLYVTAHHPASGRTFQQVLKPAQPLPTESLLGHMGLDAESLHAGASLAELRQAWAAFAPPNAHLIAWNQASLDLAVQQFAPEAETGLLKGVVCNLTHRGCGHIESVIAEQQLHAPALPARGRAGPRLGAALAVLGWLLERKSGDASALTARAPQQSSAPHQVDRNSA